MTRPQEGWDVRAHLGDPDAKQANADALLDLENGVTSLWLTVGRGGIAVADLPTVLDGRPTSTSPRSPSTAPTTRSVPPRRSARCSTSGA